MDETENSEEKEKEAHWNLENKECIEENNQKENSEEKQLEIEK